MINLSELRIGNIVLYTQDNDELPVLKIDGDNKTVCLDLLLGLNMELNEQDIDPIPITPEWLVKFGFEQNGNGWQRGGFFLISYKNDLVVGLYNGQVTNYTPIKYVHQLQNTYFFPHMTEELTIKETV